MNKRELQKEKTREIIVNAALSLYGEHGIAATTTSDIARMAKVSHGTIFLHFPTKESLVEEAIAKFGILVTMRLHEVVDRKCGMKEILKAHLEALNEHEELYIKVITEVPLLGTGVKNTLISIQTSISFHMSQVAESEMTSGKMKKMPVYLLFNSWLGLVHYYLINKELFAPDGKVIDGYGNQLIDHFMNLLSVEEVK